MLRAVCGSHGRNYRPWAGAAGNERSVHDRAVADPFERPFDGGPVDNDIWIALAWCVGITIVACAFAMNTYRRTVS